MERKSPVIEHMVKDSKKKKKKKKKKKTVFFISKKKRVACTLDRTVHIFDMRNAFQNRRLERLEALDFSGELGNLIVKPLVRPLFLFLLNNNKN